MKRPLPALIAALLLATTGCVAEAAGSTTVTEDDPALALAGTTEGGQWQSAPWTDSPWIELGQRATVTIEHGLGRQPGNVQVYLSFIEDDRGDSSRRTSFPAAGDVANIEEVSDAVVRIRNTTFGEFYMRVVLD